MLFHSLITVFLFGLTLWGDSAEAIPRRKTSAPQVQRLRQLRSNCAVQIPGGISTVTDGPAILDQIATVKYDPPHPIAPSTLRTQSQRKFPSSSYILYNLFIGVQKHGNEPSIKLAA